MHHSCLVVKSQSLSKEKKKEEEKEEEKRRRREEEESNNEQSGDVQCSPQQVPPVSWSRSHRRVAGGESDSTCSSTHTHYQHRTGGGPDWSRVCLGGREERRLLTASGSPSE